MAIAVGQVLDDLGIGLQRSQQIVEVGVPGRNFDVVECRASVHATPARNLRTRQAARISVGIGHNPAARCGQVTHREHAGRHLWACCELDNDVDSSTGCCATRR
jgi:hypothetical protein